MLFPIPAPSQSEYHIEIRYKDVKGNGNAIIKCIQMYKSPVRIFLPIFRSAAGWWSTWAVGEVMEWYPAPAKVLALRSNERTHDFPRELQWWVEGGCSASEVAQTLNYLGSGNWFIVCVWFLPPHFSKCQVQTIYNSLSGLAYMAHTITVWRAAGPLWLTSLCLMYL